jgi:hypothetical protein
MTSTCCWTRSAAKFLQALRIYSREFALNDDILAFQIAQFSELSHEGRVEETVSTRIEQPNPDELLRKCDERPSDGHAANNRHEFASSHCASEVWAWPRNLSLLQDPRE